jgi:serine/threonine protein kinase
MRMALGTEDIEIRGPQESVNERVRDLRGAEASTCLGRYELQQKLGSGTFAQVYAAYDSYLERDVALKVLNQSHLSNPDVLPRFLQEGRATAKIRHPGIVTIHECGTVDTDDGVSAYIAMEMLDGESLLSRLQRSGKLAIDTAVEITRQIACALDAAHRAGVLHRDLKPDNVFLVPDPAAMPSGERVKVIDFGLAKIGAGDITQAQMVFGTPAYMSPEQCRSTGEIDQRSDVYALGCILFELVCGRPPFEGGMRETMGQHLRTVPRRASSFNSEVPYALDELIAVMLSKDPANRPQSMAAVTLALREAGAITPGASATLMPPAANLLSLQALIAPPPIDPDPIDSTSQIQYEPVVAPIDPTQYPKRPSSKPPKRPASQQPKRRSSKPIKKRPAWDGRGLTALVRTRHRRRRTLAMTFAAAAIVVAAAFASMSLMSRSSSSTTTTPTAPHKG